MYSLKQKHSYVIINTDDSKHRGTHWCSLMRGDTNTTYFYDTYQRPFYTLSKHWKHKIGYWKQVINSDDLDEALYGNDCGQVSLAMCMTFDKYGLNALYAI